MDTQWGFCKIIILSVCKQFDQMLKIQKTVIDWCRSKHKHLLTRAFLHHVKQLAITAGSSVPEMMSFINNHDLGLLSDLVHQVLVLFQEKISMVDYFKRIEALQNLRNVLFYRCFPYRNSGSRRYHKYNIFSFLLYKAFDQHHANECFTKTYAITKERSGITVSNLDQAVIAITLILSKLLVYYRLMILPLRYGFFTTLEVLIH